MSRHFGVRSARRLEACEGRAAAGQNRTVRSCERSGETSNVAARKIRRSPRDLEARLLQYAREQKPSLWIKAQPAFVGAQGKTVMDPDFDIDDGGLPHEKLVIPH